jgi:hypothetical protein
VLAVMNVEKIQKLIKLLSSPNDGEVIGAVHALMRTLKAEGTDIHALAERLESRKLSQAETQRIYDQAFADGKSAATVDVGFSSVDPPSFYEMAQEIERKDNGRLNPKERDFVEDMVRWCTRREPSEKQGKWLHAIYCRIGRRR